MEDETKQVVITDIKMPFFSMVVFITKWMLASIPAFIIIGLIFSGIAMGLKMAGVLPELPNIPMNSSTDSGTPPPTPTSPE